MRWYSTGQQTQEGGREDWEACLGDVVHLGEPEGDAEAAEEDGDVGAGAREGPGVHGLLLGDGGEILERRRDPTQRLLRLARPHRRSRSPTSLGCWQAGGRRRGFSFFPPPFFSRIF